MDETDLIPTPPGPIPADDPALMVAPAAPAPEPPVPLSHDPAPALDRTPDQEHRPMATNYEFSKDGAQSAISQAANGAQHMADQARTQGESALKQGQAAFAQASEKSREVMDKGMKAMDEFNTHARGQADAFMTASRAATQGLEAMVSQATELGRKSFEGATQAMRTIAAARTPADVFAAQNEYMKAAFDNLVHGYSKMTETVMKVSSEVIQPLQSQMSDATQKAGDMMKSTIGNLTK